MKRILYLLLGAAMFFQFSFAQAYVREVQLFGKTRFATTAGTASGITYVTADSTVGDIPLIYTSQDGQIVNQYPDSMALAWYGKGTTNGDSVGILLVLKVKRDLNSAYVGRTVQDSAKVQENDFKLISRASYVNQNYVSIVAQQISAAGGPNKSQHISLGGVQFRCSLLLYYRRPG